ncbi:uncharacterized protein BDR25DRAFT_158866, partial [Lindgomyces ingoldianus]
ITLNVGGRKFLTRIDTLATGSGFFAAQLSRWIGDPREDGSFFIDADPDLFAHLLRHLRRPNTFPLFWNMEKGFDYALYHALYVEAEYFGIYELAKWIEAKQYLKAITIKSHGPEIHEVNGAPGQPFVMNPNVEVVQREILVTKRERFVCPRGIFAHMVQRGERLKCGKACWKVGGDDPDEYVEEAYKEAVTWKNEVIFNADVC